MVLPFVVGDMAHGGAYGNAMASDAPGIATPLYTSAYLPVTGLLGLVVFRWVGVSRLERVG